MLSKLLRRVTKKASLTHSPKLKEIESFYTRTLERFDASYRGVGWSRKSTQEIRFMILSLIADFKDARILDMGCGTGDFFAYLVENGFEGDYEGVDLCLSMIKKARTIHPGIVVNQGDIFSWKQEEPVDYVFGSGLLSYKVDQPYIYVAKAIEALFKMATQGIGLNFLSSFTSLSDRSSRFMYYKPEKILKIAQDFSPYVEFRHQYLMNDFTIFIYKH